MTKIDRISLTNFRKFERFSLRLHGRNILVGPNNCGKSSILDAFRVLDACYRYTRNHSPLLTRIDGEGYFDAFTVPERSLPFRLANATRNYSDEDAILEFWLADKTRAVIRLHPDRQVRFYIDQSQARFTSSKKFRNAFPINLLVVPTLSPLEMEETLVEDATVQRNSATRLASRVLRNIWYRQSQKDFDDFSRDVASAWPGINLRKPEIVRSNPPTVEMFFSEDRIDREVQWAGFGFQVWLQLQTHLRRGGPNSLVVIDEPDIYLHPDLQRRLLRDVSEKSTQFVMATHAVEIINEAHAEDIVTIAPGRRSGQRIKTEDDYNALYRYLGSTENVDIARAARAKQVIFVEGKDGKLLRRLAVRFGLNHLADPQSTPIIQLGGVTEWRRAVHAVWAIRKILDLEVRAFCLFDRDYRGDEEVADFIKSTTGEDFECRVLLRKEIENYLLVPEAIQKAIASRLRARQSPDVEISLAEVRELILEATEGLKTHVTSHRIANALRFERQRGSKLDESTIIGNISQQLERDWTDLAGRLVMAPGKEVLSRLNDGLQMGRQISISEAKLVEHLSASTVDIDFLTLLKDMDRFCAGSASSMSDPRALG